MRLSSNKDDPDFIGEANYDRYEAHYRGKKLDDCFEVDSRRGYAIVHARNDDGLLDIDPETGAIRTIRVEGDVKIIDKRAV